MSKGASPAPCVINRTLYRIKFVILKYLPMFIRHTMNFTGFINDQLAEERNPTPVPRTGTRQLAGHAGATSTDERTLQWLS
jgi:hypothetical protein